MKHASDPVAQTLSRFGRVTSARWWVLQTLRQAPHPLSPDEVGQAIAAATAVPPPDRVTIYRTLEWLVDQGLARRVAASDRAARFEATLDNPAHAHFLCRQCGATWCLTAQPVVLPPLPSGFIAEHAEVVVHGLCAACHDQSPGHPAAWNFAGK